MNISNIDINKLSLLDINNDNQGGILYKKDDFTLYKIINDIYFFQDELIRNIDFQINNHIPNTPKIYDKIYIDKKFSGYSMEYLDNTITFKKAICKDINYLDKIKAILDIYKTIRFLHTKSLYLGDIHLENLLISSNGNGYIVDLDYLFFPNDLFKFSQLYLVKLNNKNNKINLPSKYTDNIKAMLSSISLLFNIDIEKYIDYYSHDINVEEVYDIVIKKINDKRLNKYVSKIIKGEKIPYFDDFILKHYGINNKIKVLKNSHTT